MATRKSVDDRLAELETELERAAPEAVVGLLGTALTASQHRLVAYAARRAAEVMAYDCVPSLLAAYSRFLDKPAKRDPNCLAKAAIVRALHELDCADVDFYLAAIRYRQPEPVWGGTVDTAVDLRCSAAMGLVASGYPRALTELAPLLTDPEAPARAGAARAIACGVPREAELLLRLKALSGDTEASVIGACFDGLLAAEPEESVEFVARFLADDVDEIREMAALALGESRLDAALAHLQEAWDDVHVPDWFRRALIRAAALHRSDAAIDWLLELVASREPGLALEIVEALSPYRRNQSLAERLESAILSRSNRELTAGFAQVWQKV